MQADLSKCRGIIKYYIHHMTQRTNHDILLQHSSVRWLGNTRGEPPTLCLIKAGLIIRLYFSTASCVKKGDFFRLRGNENQTLCY